MALESPESVEHAKNVSVKPGSSEAPLDNEESLKTPLELNPHLVYKVQYRNKITEQIVYTRESESPIVIESLGPRQLPALELITNVQTHAKLEQGGKLKDPPQTVLDVETAYLKLNSPAIINALQRVVEYYPGQDFSGEAISVFEPFDVLIHHESELATFRETYAPSKTRPETECCETEKNTYEHLAVLQDFLMQRVGVSVETERLRHTRGFATFDMLWMLYKPGTTVYSDTWADGNYNAYVIQSVSVGVARGPTASLEIDMWYLDFDGTIIGRRGFKRYQSPFNGEKRISALEVIPCGFWEDKSTEKVAKGLKESLEERGKLFFKLTSRRCMNYDGLTVEAPRIHVRAKPFDANFETSWLT